ncbi:MAG: transposase [Desulfovibrio sp.]|nr:transposase [Desulfovibrio sp.]
MGTAKVTKSELTVNEERSINHTKWDCNYHVVWIPKYRHKRLFYGLRREIGPMLRELARQIESFVIEGKLFLVRGYYVSTVCLDENVIREYIRNQGWRIKGSINSVFLINRKS